MATIVEDESKQLMCNQRAYCCPAMQYFCSLKSALAETLQVLPRIILYRKPIFVGKTYETLLSIKNMGMHHRRITYSTDADDVTIKVSTNQKKSSLCLELETKFEVTIILKPKSRTSLNRRRHIFIRSEHPSMVLTVPIIIMQKRGPLISLPTEIAFPCTCIGNTTFHEIIIYNDTADKMPFSIKCNYPSLTIVAPKRNIPKQDYVTILLKLKIVSCAEVREIIKIKCGLELFDVPFMTQPMQWSLYLDTVHMQFGPHSFNRAITKTFRICNESSKHFVRFHLKLGMPNEHCAEPRTIDKNCILTSLDSGVPVPAESECRKAAANYIADPLAHHHFEYEPKCGTLAPHTSTTISVTYKPVMHCQFNPPTLPPYPIFINLYVMAKDEIKFEVKQIQLCGSILGTEIEIKPKIIDFQTVYCGEEHCAHIEVVNLDCVSKCHVDFYDYREYDEANVIITPTNGLNLKPCESGLFHLQLFAKTEGKLIIKLKFKVKNGGFFFSAVRGSFQQIRVRCFPDLIEMGTLPICVPQKRFVLVMNPLSVPITLQCTVPEDGTEPPMILDIIDTDAHLPITIKDPINQLKQCLEEENDDSSSEDGKLHVSEIDKDPPQVVEIDDSAESSLLSFRSAEVDTSSYSTDFQENALDYIPKIAPNMLHHLTKIKIFNKPDMEGKVMYTVMTDLLKTPYFCGIDKYKNYCNMDWNLLPTDPMEIYCNNEIIYLSPNTGKTLVVLIIPNVLGKRQKYLELRVCPIIAPPCDDEDPNLRQMMDSSHMKSKLWIEYNCAVPKVVWDNVIDMQDALYSGELYDFEMIFENCSKIGGFFYYELIPDNHNGCMRFLNGRWKYFVPPSSVVKVPCAVEFKKTGFIELSGLIKFVGITAGFPFHIKSEILPARVDFNPRFIDKKLPVLYKESINIYIENITPTTTWFRVQLKDETKLWVHPLGAQLAPNAQGTYITLEICYPDPGVYRNILYIHMQYEIIEKMPIILTIEGMPIFFIPDIISNGIAMGYVLCNAPCPHLMDIPSFCKTIRVINKGERCYRINITKTKTSKQICSIYPTQTRVIIKPHSFVINPKSEETFSIAVYANEEHFMYNEFRLEIIDLTDPTRIQINSFFLSADFIYPQLTWNRRDITMEYHRTHIYKEHDQWEIIKLTNVAKNYIAVVNLKVSGPFLIKNLFEHCCAKELEFSMCGLETKEFFVVLDKDSIRNRLNSSYEGRITCCAQNKTQKFVNLKVNMFIPTLVLQNNDVLLFAKDIAGATFIHLYNPGTVPAIYKWKKLQQESHYVAEEDDPQQVADIILCDILSQIEFKSSSILDNDSDWKVTKRYCLKHKPKDPIDIKSIIHKVIDDLDLLHKRYQLVKSESGTTMSYQIEEEEEEIGEEEMSHIVNMIKINVIQNSTKKLEHQIDEAMDMLAEHQHEQAMKKITKIHNQLNSRTLYFNRKFRLNSSEYNDTTIDQTTSSDTCVFHTLDHVLGHLKLEDSYTISYCSSDECDRDKAIFFFEKCGVLEAKQTELCAIHIPEVRKGFEVSALFCLDIIGGKSQEFRITCANLESAVRLSNYNVYIGLKPWYETFKVKVKVDNITHYDLNLKLNNETTKTFDRLPKMATGYVKILNDKRLQLPALKSVFLKTEGLLGFTDVFIREISIIVNDGADIPLRLRGHGVMPIFTVANHTVPYVERDKMEIEEEYQLLQKIYYYDVFKGITFVDDDIDHANEENEIKKVFSYDMELSLSASITQSDSELSMESSVLTARRERDMRFFRILQTYVLVSNNEELPNATVLNQLIETERFLNLLRNNEEIAFLLKSIYQKSLDDKMPINLRHFTIEPLPFQLRPILWDLDRLEFDKYQQFWLTLEFSGPGKLIASARTEIKIPGLLIEFRVSENSNQNDFIFYRASTTVPDKYEKTYRNLNERLLDADIDPKLKHAHSFDFDIRAEHQRDANAKERKWLMAQYDSLNKSVYLDRKQHFTYCKILSKCSHNVAGAKINAYLLIRPRRGFFYHDQQLEDYLYIDLHMGPTLALLLRGRIVDPILEQYTSQSSGVETSSS